DFWKRVRGLRTFCPYIHVPAQHGNDRVLKRMHRLYTVERYLDMVAAAHEASLAPLERVRFATSYVFKYSPRPGTPATRLEDDVPEAEKDRRCTRLVRAQEKISLELNKAAIGEELEVLVEGVSKKNETKLAGRSKDNRICVFTGSAELEGRLDRVKVRDATAHTLYGEAELARRGRALPLIP